MSDQVAATTGRIVEYAQAAAQCFDGNNSVKQTVIELAEDALICLVLLDAGAHLAVLAAAPDREQLAVDLCRLTEQLNQNAAPRRANGGESGGRFVS